MVININQSIYPIVIKLIKSLTQITKPSLLSINLTPSFQTYDSFLKCATLFSNSKLFLSLCSSSNIFSLNRFPTLSSAAFDRID